MERSSVSKNKVSVIIPVFNRSKSLREAVMSVLLQTHEDLEIIIVDDGSVDDTCVVCRELAAKWPATIILIRQNNSGPGSARENGTVNSNGEFVQYLDSDDLLLPLKLEEQVFSLKHSPKIDISYGISYQSDYSYDPPLLTGPMRSTGEEIPHLFPKLLNQRWWTTSCPLYRRSLIDRIGPWLDLINEEDWEFDARAAKLETSLVWTNIGASIRRINMNENHLSFGGYTNTRKLADRVIAKQLLYSYALSIGIKDSDPEMRLFAKESFFLSRKCAMIGLEYESLTMYRLARNASTKLKRYGFQFVIYRTLVLLFGWIGAGRFAERLGNMLRLY
jgi:glycosyltransferase involved in cell wall biosynthesis